MAEETQEIQAKFTRFRILVIGRANAGKTTILRRLCNTTGEAIIFSPNGEKIESSTLNPTVRRGEHNIENQMVFQDSPGFIFHDSRGFEAGDTQELKVVQQFIAQRSKSRSVNKQLHAIWYCIPASDDRPITKAEKTFFNECGTGLVPVIVVWTKTEALDVEKIIQLMDNGKSLSEAMQQAPQKAWAEFEKSVYRHFVKFKYPPKAFVILRKMHEPGADCNDLIEKTAATLSSKELQQLFLSTQQNNVELCIKYGVKRMVMATESALLKYFKHNKGNWLCFIAIVLDYFPHILIKKTWDDFRKYERSIWDDFRRYEIEFFEEEEEREDFWSFKETTEHYNDDSVFKIISSILSGLSVEFNLKDATYCAIVAAIIGHLSFFLHKESPDEQNSLERAAQMYQESTRDKSVKKEVGLLFAKTSQVDNAFLKTFKWSQVDHAMLVEGAIRIALNNLMERK